MDGNHKGDEQRRTVLLFVDSSERLGRLYRPHDHLRNRSKMNGKLMTALTYCSIETIAGKVGDPMVEL